ncbi:MAG: phytanoyl-CoA dioxygenase family protein [Gammaproteobacteria bacterium]|nr:phytanoyl-CoA dioxygenase family protein [Gammaproteobacteria bacterium]
MNAISNIFSGTHHIQSLLLNYLGIQAFRALAATTNSFARNRQYKPKNESLYTGLSKHIETLRLEGVVVIDNFLEENHFNKVITEFNSAISKPEWTKTIDHNETQGCEVGLSRIINSLPAIKQFIESPRLQYVFEACESRDIVLKSGCLESYQKTKDEGSDGLDYTTRIHSDIFYPTHKAWLLLEDIDVESGPFWYARHSHKLTLKRLIFEYHSGILSAKGKHPNLFYDDNILNKFKKLELSPIIGRKNSLIIADTHGFHKRGIAKHGKIRQAIRLSQRHDPFSSEN